MAIKTKRRARFRRATSGTQNLTMLIYNILREQIASRKSAIMAAFNANMSSKSYDSTYGGQPVDRQAVEAFYAEMISTYPPGTTERDKLMAELAEFRNDSMKAEMNAYADAYENGTVAFGEQIDLNAYLSFLREAKSLTTNESDRIMYTKEEFIATFNDVNMDLKAKGASAAKFVRFYERELKRAEEMGLTKDMTAYRSIQGYLAAARKQSAAEFKSQALQDAVDFVSKNIGKIGSSLNLAMGAAVQKGVLDQATYLSMGTDGMTLTNNFLKLDLAMQARILIAGQEAGIQLNGEILTSNAMVDALEDVRERVKTLATSKGVDSGTRDRMTSLLDEIDQQITGPMGLMNDVEKADRASLDLIIDNEKMFGNPVANTDAYARHADRIEALASGDLMGQALKDILRGKVPGGGEEFLDASGNKKTELWQLNDSEVSRLVDTYTGTALFWTNASVDPKELITNAVSDYKSKHAVETGSGFLVMTRNESGTPEIQVSATPITGGIPTLASDTLSDKTVASVVASQVKQPVVNSNGDTIGHKFFEIDVNRNPVDKFITIDGYTMDMDRFELYLNDVGVPVSVDGNGQVVVGSIDPFVGDSSRISEDPIYGADLSSRPFTGIAKGPGYSQALVDVSKSIANTVIGSGSGSIFSVDPATGRVTVIDSDRARELTQFDARTLEVLLNTPEETATETTVNGQVLQKPTQAQQIIGTAMFRYQEGVDSRALLGQPNDPAQLLALRTAGSQAAARVEDTLRRQERIEIYGRSPYLNSPMPRGFAPGISELGLSPADAARLAELEGAGPASQRFQEVYQPELTRQRVLAEMQASPAMPPGVKSGSGMPTSDYFFRYSSPKYDAMLTQSTYLSDGGVPITGGGVSLSPPKSPTFTPAQVNQSLIDFRAQERVGVGVKPMSISTAPKTASGGGI